MRPGITDSAIKGIIAVFIILKDYVKLWMAHMDFIKGNGRRFDLFIDFVIPFIYATESVLYARYEKEK